jgi:hypothetical protein
MKKLFTSIAYKNHNLKRAAQSLKMRLAYQAKRKALRRGISGVAESAKRQTPSIKRPAYSHDSKPLIEAPADFRLIENTQACLLFFRDIRSEECVSYARHRRFVAVSMKNVTQIDYGTISILTAISDDLQSKRTALRGDFPRDESCRQFIARSGFLNHMVDDHNRPFTKSDKSDLIAFEKGSGVLSGEDNKKISQLIQNVVKHLTGAPQNSSSLKSIKSILLEICGNSIEWSGTGNKQWLLGAKYEPDKVIFTVTDVGKGILETLYKKRRLQVHDALVGRPNHEVLKGAFGKKYGSTSQQVNRNKGLPSVKASFEDGKIAALKVLTNNVLLHFGDDSLSYTFAKGSPRFRGTFYQWEMNKDCINR